MKNLFLFSIVTIFILSSCSKNETSQPEGLKWSYNLESYDSEEVAPIYNPIIYENIVIVPQYQLGGQSGALIAFDKLEGTKLWTWTDAFDKYGSNGFSARSYAYDGILVVGSNNYTAGIDIYTGETIWEDIDNMLGLAALSGVRENIFKSSLIEGEKIFIKKGNIFTGEWETIYELDKEPGFNLDSNTPTAVEWQGKTYLAFHRINWKTEDSVYEANMFLNFYNVTDNVLAWESDTIPLDHAISHIPGVFPVFTEGKILLANGAIYAYDMKDGNLSWKKSYGNSFSLSSNLAASNGRVYGNNADGYFVCLDAHTGQEYYNVTTGFSASRVQVYNGKCYMSSVSDQFMVLDAENGNILHALDSPFVNEHDEASLQAQLTVDQETGLAYTADFKTFLCYDFE